MSAHLAPELARYRSALEIFPDEHADALGKMVQRISSLVGRLSATYLQGVDPNGFDGVEQRGEYHRLLTSEWLLAEEVPEEFLRRAAMNEHLFLRLARKEPRGGRRCLAFFDAGPMQLGSPRLVHLTALLALHHRAVQAGAKFQWAVIQSPGSVGEAVGESDVKSLLKARSAALVDEQQVHALLRSLNSPQDGDDIWWVGDSTLQDLPGSSLTIVDELSQDTDSLRLVLKQGERTREASLPLPSSAMQTRLMRDPFERPGERRPPAQDLENVNFWLSYCGRYVFLRDRHEVHLVNLTFAGNRRTFDMESDDGKMVAIARSRKGIATVRRNGGTYVLSAPGATLGLVFDGRRPEPRLGQAPLWEIFVVGKRLKKLVLRDSTGTVFVGEQVLDKILMKPVLDRCIRLIWRQGHIEYICRTPDLNLEFGILGLDFTVNPRGRGDSTRPVALAAGYDVSGQLGVFAHATPTTRRTLESGASRVGFTTWSLRLPYAPSTTFLVREHLSVLALVKQNHEWRPLVLSEDRRELQVIADNDVTTVASFHDPVERWETASTRSCVVCEQGGGLAVIQFQDGQEPDIGYVSLPKLRQEGSEAPE